MPKSLLTDAEIVDKFAQAVQTIADACTRMERALDAQDAMLERANRTLGIKPPRHLSLVQREADHA